MMMMFPSPSLVTLCGGSSQGFLIDLLIIMIDKSKKFVPRPAFVEPQGLIVKEGARVMSLQDGSSKMSKSSDNDNSRINLLDPPELIAKKIKRCKTDTFRGK